MVMGGRLMFRRSWVRIPAPYTGSTFFTFICCLFQTTKINEKDAGDGLLKKIGQWSGVKTWSKMT